MCLVINSRYHCKNTDGQYEPLIAKEDIPVYKLLEKIHDQYITPFLCKPIVFVNGIAVQETSKFTYGNDTYLGRTIHTIRVGIHSTTISFTFGFKLACKAIIPKGTEYYVGIYNEMVSKKLIIFETEEDYQKYIKNNPFK